MWLSHYQIIFSIASLVILNNILFPILFVLYYYSSAHIPCPLFYSLISLYRQYTLCRAWCHFTIGSFPLLFKRIYFWAYYLKSYSVQVFLLFYIQCPLFCSFKELMFSIVFPVANEFFPLDIFSCNFKESAIILTICMFIHCTFSL